VCILKDHSSVRTVKSALESATLFTGLSLKSQIGEALESAFKEGLVKREDLHVTSKLWNDHHAADEVPEALKKTLADLKLDYLDLYLVRGVTAVMSFLLRMVPDRVPQCGQKFVYRGVS
jgi:predicted aldo/keto reductase-like oxidoreductase